MGEERLRGSTVRGVVKPLALFCRPLVMPEKIWILYSIVSLLLAPTKRKNFFLCSFYLPRRAINNKNYFKGRCLFIKSLSLLTTDRTTDDDFTFCKLPFPLRPYVRASSISLCYEKLKAKFFQDHRKTTDFSKKKIRISACTNKSGPFPLFPLRCSTPSSNPKSVTSSHPLQVSTQTVYKS